MAKNITSNLTNIANHFPAMIIGLCLGGLVGLSVSPTISIVITSIIAFIITFLPTLINLRQKSSPPESSSKDSSAQSEAQTSQQSFRTMNGEQNIRLLPFAVLMIGLLVGGGAGVWVRTHNWLGEQEKEKIKAEIQMWKELKIHVTEEEILRNIFEKKYPKSEILGQVNKEELRKEIEMWTELVKDEEKEKIKNKIISKLIEKLYPQDVKTNVPDKEKPSESDQNKAEVQGSLLGDEAIKDFCHDLDWIKDQNELKEYCEKNQRDKDPKEIKVICNDLIDKDFKEFEDYRRKICPK